MSDPKLNLIVDLISDSILDPISDLWHPKNWILNQIQCQIKHQIWYGILHKLLTFQRSYLRDRMVGIWYEILKNGSDIKSYIWSDVTSGIRLDIRSFTRYNITVDSRSFLGFHLRNHSCRPDFISDPISHPIFYQIKIRYDIRSNIRLNIRSKFRSNIIYLTSKRLDLKLDLASYWVSGPIMNLENHYFEG
jgi:hypothetical protein